MSTNSALHIQCSHQQNGWTELGTIDECLVRGLAVDSPKEPITSVSLSVDRYSDSADDKDKIISFYIYMSPMCYYVPSGIGENFKNIKVLVIANTGLKAVTQADLRPLKNLRYLYLDKNNLEVLENNLFMHNRAIEKINLSDNKIKTVGGDVFKPLTKLKRLNMLSNICINLNSEDHHELLALKTTLKKQCLPVHEENSDENVV